MVASMTDARTETELSAGEVYWAPYSQIDRIVDELLEVKRLLERHEVVNAYNAVIRTRHNAVSLWSEMRPKDVDE